MKRTNDIHPDPENPRKHFDEQELDRLGDDMLARGVLVPLLLKPNDTIIDGERRWRAARLKGIEELPVIVTDKPEKEILGIQLATVFHKLDLSAYEKCEACKKLADAHPDWQSRDVAEFLHVDGSSITRMLSFTKCITAWKEAFKAGTVGMRDVYAASKLPESELAALLALKLSGASCDDLERVSRKKRNSTPAVRVNRIKCPLPSGSVVQVSGEEIGLDDAVDALKEAVKAMQKASETGLDAKTAQAVWRDMASAK